MATPDSENIAEELNTRLNVYMSVLKSAEEEGNSGKVRRYKRIIKQYTDAIKLNQNGKPVPFDELPNPPGLPPLGGGLLSPHETQEQLTPNPSPQPVRRTTPSPSPSMLRKPLNNTDVKPVSPRPPRKIDVDMPDVQLIAVEPEENQVTNIEIPEIVMDEVRDDTFIDLQNNPEALLAALQSRMDTYTSVKEAAEREGNSSKVRRYQRILKQYKDAIKSLKDGKPVPLEELPNPPGFAPLVPPKSAEPSPLPERKEIDTGKLKDVVSSGTADVSPKFITSRAEKQTLELKQRQQEYKQAALNAKKQGQLEEAKEYLKIFKGFDRLIQASEGGLPVDMTTIPLSPNTRQSLDNSFHIVTDADFIEGDSVDLYTKLETELTDQVKSCLNIRNNFKSNGDIANANRFEQFALHFKKDLNSVQAARQRGDPLPKFHYENKSFGIIQCFNDLQSNELELSVVQGINYKVSNPDEVDTYIRYEFPYPSENPPKGKTEVVKNTNNPQYNFKTKFTIHREVKACQRIFKRHGIKIEVMSKTGFFHSDVVLGTVVVKLMSLNTELLIHDAFDLMNGRRATGGKLEVKVRIREPLLSKKLEQVSEKWIILD